MSTEAVTSALPVPQLDPAVVAAWRERGGELVELLAAAREGLGPVAGVPVGDRPTVLVTGPAEVQYVLAHHPDRYVKRSHRARMLIGDGVLAATGESWKRQRKLLQGQFTGTGMRRYERRIAAAARTSAERWAGLAADGRVLDLGDEMRRFALDTIWRSLTGHPLDEATDRELGAVATVVARMPELPADASDAAEAVAGELARIDLIAERAVEAARSGPAGPDGPGLLALLTEEGNGYTDRLIRDELVTLLVAGHETTATTLTWLYLLLDRHPGAREAALAAGVEGSPQRREAVLALVHETLRLYPSAWLLPRHSLEADLLGGHRIEAGTDVLVCPYLTHRDPARWPDPERFDPTRFTAPGRRPAELGAYLPFGLGARACLGTQFALRETAALLELLLPAWTVSLHNPPAGASYSITVRPDGPVLATLTASR